MIRRKKQLQLSINCWEWNCRSRKAFWEGYSSVLFTFTCHWKQMTRTGASSTIRAVELKEFAIGNPSTQLTKQSVQYCEDSCIWGLQRHFGKQMGCNMSITRTNKTWHDHCNWSKYNNRYRQIFVVGLVHHLEGNFSFFISRTTMGLYCPQERKRKREC